MGVRITSFYHDRLTVNRLTKTVDTHGVPRESFTPNGVLPARVHQLSGQEMAAMGRQEHEAVIQADIDENSDVLLSDRLAWDRDPGWLYEVSSIDKAHRQWTITAKRVTR